MKYYTVAEAAAVCRVSVFTLRQWIKDGKIKATKPGKSYLISEENLTTYLKEKHG